MLDPGTPSACGYLRLFLPLSKKIVTNFFDVRFIHLEDIELYSADIVITQRAAIDSLPKALKLLAYCKIVGARLIYDLDDDLLCLPSQHPEVETYDAFKHVVVRLITEADEMWVSTAALASRYAGIAKRVQIMPNELDDRVWDSHARPTSNSVRPIRFLYMGTSSHRPDFEHLIRPAFTQLRSEFGKSVELDLIGVTVEPGRAGEWQVLSRPPHAGKSYPSFITWLQSLPPYDVGLAPLLDCVFNNCKSDVKWLEYAALGLATVAVNLPAYNQSLEHERTGLLADPDPRSFLAAMRRLTEDEALRQSLQRQAVQLVRERLQFSSTAEPRLTRLLVLADQPGVTMTPIATRASAEFHGHIDRAVLSHAFVHGMGIEIGALHNPLPVSQEVHVIHVDRMSRSDLRAAYPELRGQELVDIDILDDGESLSSFEPSSQDFIIANHFIEHCQDPIQTLKTFVRVLRPGGFIYMAIPNMQYTFDCNREQTSLTHIIYDHVNGPGASRLQHFREWVTLVEPQFGCVYSGDAVEVRVHELMREDYSINFHTFVPESVDALLAYCVDTEHLPLSVAFAGIFGNEMIYIVRKLMTK